MIYEEKKKIQKTEEMKCSFTPQISVISREIVEIKQEESNPYHKLLRKDGPNRLTKLVSGGPLELQKKDSFQEISLGDEPENFDYDTGAFADFTSLENFSRESIVFFKSVN